MSARDVLLLGDHRLRQRAAEVIDFDDAVFRDDLAALAATLDAFRKRHGFGRAIAAPQIGVSRRLIAMNLGEGTFFLVNPQIRWTSDEAITMWDDCMSFPELLVRVRRARSLSLSYRDENGDPKSWERLDTATSELLQHEIDHLDGILAVDRALDRDAIIMRSLFDERREEYARMVDYVITPTL